MSLLLVVRLTRGEEDSGRLELVRAMPVGRHASLAAGPRGRGRRGPARRGARRPSSSCCSDLPVAGSIVLGASFTRRRPRVRRRSPRSPRRSRRTRGSRRGWPARCSARRSWCGRWATPGRRRAVVGVADRLGAEGPALRRRRAWWPLGLCLVVAVALGAARPRWLEARRDFGAGLVAAPARTGRAAAPGLRSPLALAFRLQRGAVVWWTVSVVAMAVAWGSLANSIEDFTKDNQALEDMLARSGQREPDRRLPLDHAALLGPRSPGARRCRSSPGCGPRRPSTGPTRCWPRRVTRTGWAGGHLAAALAGSGLAVVAGGLGLGATYGLVIGDAGQVPRLVGASLVYLPPVWLLAGLAVALLGAAPRWVAARGGSGRRASCSALFGTLIDVPEAVRDLSPFEAVPALPAESMHLCRSSSWPRSPRRSWRPASPPSAAATSVDGDRDGLRSATGPTAGSSRREVLGHLSDREPPARRRPDGPRRADPLRRDRRGGGVRRPWASPTTPRRRTSGCRPVATTRSIRSPRSRSWPAAPSGCC